MRRLQFKFLSQIRISGWDFGSSARAMNQAGGFISTQADLEKVSRSTTERKSMSTKTTIKRIALVAVSALGLGLVSTVSATAATGTYTSSFALDTTSLTVVNSTAASAGVNYGMIGVSLTDDAGHPHAFYSNESITVAVTAWPATETTSAPNDFVFTNFSRTTTTSNNNKGGTWADSPTGAGSSNAYQTGNRGSYAINQYTSGGSASGANYGVLSKYYVGIGLDQNKKALDKGAYTIRFRLTDGNGFITDKTVQVKFVTSAADSGAVITLAQGGNVRTGETITYGANNYLSATLKDANGGLIQTGSTAAFAPGLPALTAAIWGGSTAAIVDATTKFYVYDTGTESADYSGAVPGTETWASDSGTAFSAYGNGVYGVVTSLALTPGETTNSRLPAVTGATVSPYLRVTYGSTAKTLALTVYSASAGTAGTPVITASGMSALTTSTPYKVPLTTKSFTYTVSGATAGQAYVYNVAWTNTATGDQTPADSTPTTVYANSSGNVTFTVTNANPVDGAKAVVSVTGFATNPADQTVTWSKGTAATISVSLNGAYVALKSTNKFVATVTDDFGNPVSGVVLQPSLSTTSSNYTASIASVVTGADGTASYSLTDAAAVAAGTDKVSFVDVAGTLTAVSSTITYAATAPAVTSMTAYYSPSATATTAAAVATAVPTSGIYADSSGTKFKVVIAKTIGAAVTTADTTVTSGVASGDQLVIRIATGKAGATVTATASTGAYIKATSGFAVSSTSKYTSSVGDAYFVVGTNVTGANTITFTSGTATTSVAFWSTTVAASARFLTLTKGTVAGSVVAKLADRYGNGISGVSVQIGTDSGTLGNGQMTTVYTTDANGQVTVVPVGAANDTANITALVSTTGDDTTSIAGYVGSTAVDTTLAAGTRTATLAVSLGTSGSDAAQAATDAANEATDAANAATDAANAAAEAADAATAAAQDAQAAVAALASQVADLIAGIKAQITALTNLVIKIQKKVKA